MAFENVCNTVPGLVAAADLSAKQHLLVKVTATNAVNVAGAGELALGVLQNKPTSGQGATVAVAGSTSKVVSGAPFVVGAHLASDVNGKAVLATTGDDIFGVALEAATAADELVTVFLINKGLSA